MSPLEFRETLKRLGLSYSRAAELLHLHPRTVALWASLSGPGAHYVSPMAKVVLRAMDEDRLTADEVKRLAQ